MTTAGRKPIACWLETNEKIPTMDSRRQSKRGGDQECTQNQRGEFELNPKGSTHSPTQSAKQPTNEPNKTEKNNGGAEAREEGDRKSETQEEKKARRKGGEALHKG